MKASRVKVSASTHPSQRHVAEPSPNMTAFSSVPASKVFFSKVLLLSMVVALLGGLGGCGQKGPLTLPQNNPENTQPAPEE